MITCPICGTDNEAGTQYCGNCGATLAGFVSPAPGTPNVPLPPWSPPVTPAAPNPPAAPVGAPYAPPPRFVGPYPAYPGPLAPPKRRGTTLIVEIVPALFGIFGIGWFYAGLTGAGLAWLIGMLVWDAAAVVLALVTGGAGCLCLLPINVLLIGLSSALLDNHMRRHPEVFGP